MTGPRSERGANPAPGAAGRARLFFALWPDEEVRDALAALACAAQAHCGGRATPREKIHLTLFFVGSIERSRVAAMEAVGRRVRAGAFELTLEVLGYWRHNGIVWAGTKNCPSALLALAADLAHALAREGVQGDERPYVPHITLVRNAIRAPAAVALTPCVWRADDFVLLASVPHRGGVRYEPLARWPLMSPL